MARLVVPIVVTPKGGCDTGIVLVMPALPSLHESGLDPRDLIGLADIARIKGSPKYAALRSYSTGRRTNSRLKDMPLPVCTVGGARLWLKHDIDVWLKPFTRLQRK